MLDHLLLLLFHMLHLFLVLAQLLLAVVQLHPILLSGEFGHLGANLPLPDLGAGVVDHLEDSEVDEILA